MKNKQGITIAALIVAIVGLSIGFAAFSNTLTISSSASVNPSDENFIVQFSKYSDSDATGTLNPITPTALTSDYGENGLIPDSNKKKLQDLHATFTAPGQSVTYELYVRNTGAYVAYLKELSFANAEHATSGETYKHCYAATTREVNGETKGIPESEQATQTLVSAACNGISISVSIGTATNITPDSASKSLGNQALAANNGNVKATITISYTGNDFVDGPMEVEFGDISFNASTNPGTSQQEQGSQGGEQEEPQTSLVAGTYNTYMDGMIDYIELNNDGTASLKMGEESMLATYNYDDSNDTVTISSGGNNVLLNYYSVNGNKLLTYDNGNLNFFTTNGIAGLPTLSGTYTVPGSPTFENPDGQIQSYVFSNDGTISGDNTGKYIVLNNKVYIQMQLRMYTCTPNDDFSVLTSDSAIFTLQS